LIASFGERSDSQPEVIRSTGLVLCLVESMPCEQLIGPTTFVRRFWQGLGISCAKNVMFVSVQLISILRGITINTMIISEEIDPKRLHPEIKSAQECGYATEACSRNYQP
jgi:hypothetical protein